jgi:hypothetical protein
MTNRRLFYETVLFSCWYQWPLGVRRGSAAVRLQGLWVLIPRIMDISFLRVLCFSLEVSAMSWSFVQGRPTDCSAPLCDLETSRIRIPWSAMGHSKKKKKCFHFLRVLPCISCYRVYWISLLQVMLDKKKYLLFNVWYLLAHSEIHGFSV